MKLNSRQIFLIICSLVAIAGILLLSGWSDYSIAHLVESAAHLQTAVNWTAAIHFTGTLLFGAGLLLVAFILAWPYLTRIPTALRTQLAALDGMIDGRLAATLDLSTGHEPAWPLPFNRFDWLAVALFVLLGLIMQISSLSPGFPNVILGGDAANIASFAAGRAYPQLFTTDAILGNLNNIGLYTTIHLPISIFLAKLVGNFGLAYSLLVFPHVFMQYLAYYLLGRVILKNRWWAFLFTLAIAAPMDLAGGEVWGVATDAMPRITYQILIPFLLILLLTTWRSKPARWVWVMIIAGLMAFIHPVSTPAWAFALWIGFWPNLPQTEVLRDKLLRMFRLGVVLVLALLPYASIYLYFHKSGGAGANYDLVYNILTNYFPENLLNIPAAVQTFLQVTGKYGLLYYGLIGLLVTFLLFRTERPRLKQMLLWIAGIAFVTVLVPWVEHSIERSLRMIPIETELMRGMRYLVPFLFIFWFYPLAELTNRALKPRLVRFVLVFGTILTLIFMAFDTPLPFTSAPDVFSCWGTGHILCPTDLDYSDVLTHIRTGTPEKAQFVVFLTNRWSGIEVRYLGLRPMAYAFKDRGQLAFTNLQSLQTWYYFLNRENAVFSRNISPTLDDKRKRMIDFARDAEANYLLTDFPFPPDVQKAFGVTALYHNKTYTILTIYHMRK